jgi:hypothetical protein
MANGKSRTVARGVPTGKVWLKAHATSAMGHHIAWHWQWACRTSAGLHTTTNTSRRAPACLLQENRIQDRNHGFSVHSQDSVDKNLWRSRRNRSNGGWHWIWMIYLVVWSVSKSNKDGLNSIRRGGHVQVLHRPCRLFHGRHPHKSLQPKERVDQQGFRV